MYMKKYLIRLDDACPTMDARKWKRMEDILNNYNIRPLVGIIPNNKDSKQEIDTADLNFWENARSWESKGYAIALHGCDHCYISSDGGINPLWSRSEFAGVAYKVQCDKIREGYGILKEKGLSPKYFFAPSNTFDKNTLKALKECTDIRIISDTIATRPYKMNDFVVIPQLGGHCREIKIPGVWTFCLHPSTMSELNFVETEKFIQSNRKHFVGFDELDLTDLKGKDLFSRVLSWLYFAQRKLRRIK